MAQKPRLPRILLSLTLMTIVTVVGLTWRLAPLHLPFFFFKYGGSMLWAVALYWLVAAVLSRSTPRKLAVVAALAAAAVEFSRLWHTPAFDAFRVTLTGKLLLGRFFSLKNIVAYWLAIAMTASLDEVFQRRRIRQPSTPQ